MHCIWLVFILTVEVAVALYSPGYVWNYHRNGACLSGLNNQVHNGVSLKSCKRLCYLATSFVCRSIDYNSVTNRCCLSSYRRGTAWSNYDTTCGDYQYWEKSPYDWIYVTYDHHKRYVSSYNGYRNTYYHSSMTAEGCKQRCSEYSSFLCMSYEFFKPGSPLALPRCRVYSNAVWDGVNAGETSSNAFIVGYKHPCNGDYTVTCHWAVRVGACIYGHNNKVYYGISSLTTCMSKCRYEITFLCNSLDYHAGNHRCYLSNTKWDSDDYVSYGCNGYTFSQRGAGPYLE